MSIWKSYAIRAALFLALIALAVPAWSMERASGFCENGDVSVTVGGLPAAPQLVQGSYPNCTITVYDTGTLTLATLYSDNAGTPTPLSNPFTSSADGSWFFYAVNGRYDIRLSGAGIPTAFTHADLLLCDPSDPTGSFTCTGTNTGLCPLGPTDTRFVDSGSGSDANIGRNWCSAYATESAAVTALAATGGWVYVAPNYAGAAATSVPSNIHILQTNQFDSLGSTATRFSFPDWADTTEDHPSFFAGASATPADAAAAFTMLGPFGNSNLVSGVTGAVTVPTTSSAYPSEQAGVAGIVTNNSTSGNVSQSDGLYGACYNPAAASLDCTGIVGVAGNHTSGAVGLFEAGWLNLSLGTTPSDAMGLVIRATGGHMPTAELGSLSGRPNAAVDVSFGGGAGSGNSFPSGLYFEASSVANWPIVFSVNSVTNNPYTNIYTFGLWKDYYFSTLYDSLSVVKLNNGGVPGVYQRGNLLFNNSDKSTEVVLPLTQNGTVSVDSINAVNSATPTYDRTLGKVKTTVLSANVTSSTLTNCVAGQTIIFDIIENATGGFTYVPPANLHGFGTITTTAGTHNRQEFYCDGTSTDSGGWSISAMQSGT